MQIQSLSNTPIRFEGSKKPVSSQVTFGMKGPFWDYEKSAALDRESLKEFSQKLQNLISKLFKR